jgi:hypothetical protein
MRWLTAEVVRVVNAREAREDEAVEDGIGMVNRAIGKIRLLDRYDRTAIREHSKFHHVGNGRCRRGTNDGQCRREVLGSLVV